MQPQYNPLFFNTTILQRKHLLRADKYKRFILDVQRQDYAHRNPVRAWLCQWPEVYRWSSALFYLTGMDNLDWLTHVMDQDSV